MVVDGHCVFVYASQRIGFTKIACHVAISRTSPKAPIDVGYVDLGMVSVFLLSINHQSFIMLIVNFLLSLLGAHQTLEEVAKQPAFPGHVLYSLNDVSNNLGFPKQAVGVHD